MPAIPDMPENNDQPRSPLQDSVVDGPETCTSPPGPDPVGECRDAVSGLVADVIDPEAARSRGDDLNRLDELLAGQALVLDLIFSELAMESVADATRLPAVLGLALKAQSQSRVTLSTLASLAGPRVTPERSQRNLGEQTGANGKKPSP